MSNVYHTPWVDNSTLLSTDYMESSLQTLDAAMSRFQHLMVCRDGYNGMDYPANQQLVYWGQTKANFLDSTGSLWLTCATAAANNFGAASIYAEGTLAGLGMSTVFGKVNDQTGIVLNASADGSIVLGQFGNPTQIIPKNDMIPLWQVGSGGKTVGQSGDCLKRTFSWIVTAPASASYLRMTVPYSASGFGLGSSVGPVFVQHENAAAKTLMYGGEWVASYVNQGSFAPVLVELRWRTVSGPLSVGTEKFTIVISAVS